MAADEGIGTEYKQKVTAQITNINTGEMYTSRFPITGTNQIYVPVEIQKMLKDSRRITPFHVLPPFRNVCAESAFLFYFKFCTNVIAPNVRGQTRLGLVAG
ncbi:MAG: hypothetical protein PVG39_30530 [Desulfobacteraceae bacterium]